MRGQFRSFRGHSGSFRVNLAQLWSFLGDSNWVTWGHIRVILYGVLDHSKLGQLKAVLGQSGSFLGNFWVILDVRKTEISYLDNII